MVELRRLSDYDWTDNQKLMEIIKKIENLYLNVKKQAREQIIGPMLIDNNSNVVSKEHAVNHRCSNSLESLRTISKYGLLASEWFRILEREREGCFCAFVSRMKGENYPYHVHL